MGKLYLGDSMLSERLLDIRDEAELNQEDMAEILKVSQSNYSRSVSYTHLTLPTKQRV